MSEQISFTPVEESTRQQHLRQYAWAPDAMAVIDGTPVPYLIAETAEFYRQRSDQVGPEQAMFIGGMALAALESEQRHTAGVAEIVGTLAFGGALSAPDLNTSRDIPRNDEPLQQPVPGQYLAQEELPQEAIIFADQAVAQQAQMEEFLAQQQFALAA